ncbi:hypothetical protein JKP88DRAFT_167482 [Tribonema minus]|uniref:Uncharacterized protein n=1 Tax=Tribonema minus TaxID=303371 RepID=A0A835YQW6_9STRA|nr:hypothetical protein JKP88DRAFT_167482 [Tribonema minus]
MYHSTTHGPARVLPSPQCHAEMCTLRDDASLVARRRHYHARCEHRHSTGPKTGMRFHHHQLEKIRKHQSAHAAEASRDRGGAPHLDPSMMAELNSHGIELHNPEAWPPEATRHLDTLVRGPVGRPSSAWGEFPRALAAALPGFTVSPQQCLLHWRLVINNGGAVTGVRTWSDVEDARLNSLVNMFGTKWSAVAQLLPGREPKQCRERFLNVVDPSKTRKAWTPEEDELLLRVHDRVRNQFARTAKYFSDRSYNEVRPSRVQCVAAPPLSSIARIIQIVYAWGRMCSQPGCAHGQVLLGPQLQRGAP